MIFSELKIEDFSFFKFSNKDFKFSKIFFVTKLFLPIDNATFPSLSFLISTNLFLTLDTVFVKSSETVPNFGLGIKPFGPKIFPNLPTFGIIEGVQINLLNLISPEEIFFIKSSDPKISAPLFLASDSLFSSQRTAIFTFLPFPFGNSITVLIVDSDDFSFLIFTLNETSIDSSNFVFAKLLRLSIIFSRLSSFLSLLIFIKFLYLFELFAILLLYFNSHRSC